MKLCKAEGMQARLSTLSVRVWHECVPHGELAGVTTE